MQDGLRELLRRSNIRVSCGAEVETVEKALDSVGGYWCSVRGDYWSVDIAAGYLVVDSNLKMSFKTDLSAYDTKHYKEVTVGEIINLMDSAYQAGGKEYKTEISLGSGVVLRTNGKVTYEGSGVVVVE